MCPQAEYRDALFVSEDSRSNFKNVIAKRDDLVRIDGGRLGPSQNGQTLEAGTVLGFAASGGDAGFFKPYASGNTDGSEVAVGVLAEQAVVESSGDGSEIAIIKAGVLFKDLLVGYDATAKTGLRAVESVEHGTNLVSISA